MQISLTGNLFTRNFLFFNSETYVCGVKTFNLRTDFHSFVHFFYLIGPVVFPDPPQDGPMESSGVIVGASGFGFVPPSGQPDHSKR